MNHCCWSEVIGQALLEDLADSASNCGISCSIVVGNGTTIVLKAKYTDIRSGVWILKNYSTETVNL